MTKPRYYLEVDASDYECHKYNRWSGYGLITSEGRTIMEILENAVVEVLDQEGKCLDRVPVILPWMTALIKKDFFADQDRAAEHLSFEQIYSEELAAEMKREDDHD